MVGIKNNRRTQNTLAVIRASFLELLSGQDISQITVKEICLKAKINRGTFYLHYKDTNDLFLTIENELLEEVRPLLQLLPRENLEDWLRRLFRILQNNAEMAQILMKNYRQESLINEIFAEVHDQALQEFEEKFQEKDPKRLEYYFTYFVQGTLGAIIQWFENKQDITTEEMSAILAKLLA